MKKVVGVLTLVLFLMGSMMVFASEDVTSNMDSETYLSVRLEQIAEALEVGKITQEQADLLTEHVKAMAEAGTYGNGPANGVKGEGNAECILGEGTHLGIFRSESAGMRLGNGNGAGQKNGRGYGNHKGQGFGCRYTDDSTEE